MMHIILLRGLAREAAHWGDFPSLLQKKLGDKIQIHALDFPGCGKYFSQPALTSVSAMTEHARREIAAISNNANADSIYLIGISMGGMIALDWAQRFPQEMRGLVLINSSAGNQPFWWRLRPGVWLKVIWALIASTQTREAGVLKIVSNNRADYSQHLTQWLAIQQQRPVARATILTMLRAAARFRPQSSCSVNGLILASTHDRMVSVRASEALARQFYWPLVRHDSAGHDLPMDAPEWLVKQVADWLDEFASNHRKNTM